MSASKDDMPFEGMDSTDIVEAQKLEIDIINTLV
eukprot:SAG31_NODE_1795_length_7248_cov_682.054833_4_plen_34_part_00